MTRTPAPLGSALALAVASLLRPVAAEALPPPLVFSQAPVLAAGRLPAPNVFLALHGSAMQRAHLPSLKSALRREFAAGRLADGRIRLAWQATGQCEDLPDPGALCGGRNGLAVLDDAHRLDLDAFVDGLAEQAGGGAGTVQSLVRKAEAHLAAMPGAEATLGCRQTHVLLAAASAAPPVGERSSLALHDAAVDGSDLATALATVLAESTRLPTQVIGSMVAGAQTVHAARYSAERWSGEVLARPLTPDAAAPDGVSSAAALDARDPDTRVILSSQGSGSALRGIAWRWEQLAPAQQAALNAEDGQGPQRLDYLRGERSGEIEQGGRFRNRASRQADSVNSRLWHAPGRRPMLYLGGNGGMLHGFDAATGSEQFAYVPQGVHPHLALLTQPQYVHRPYVDGPAFTGELLEGGQPRTWLAGFLGAGGTGYFVLDASDPAAMAEEQAAQFVKLDTSADADPDLGHIFGEPVRERGAPARTRQITRLNDGRWALVTGNGYNSAAQRAVLLVQYLDGARERLKIPAGEAGGNGLSPPRLVDLDGDQVPDLAYAGDLHGQLWKFELGDGDATQWRVAFEGRPLFVARDAAGKRQPISAAPLWLPHPQGGRMIVVGTGRLLTDADRADGATQSVYGVHDLPDAGPLPAGRGALVQQRIDSEAAGSVAGQLLWRSSAHAVPTRGSEARRGWYLDLPLPGERVIAHPDWYEGKLIDLTSIVPPAADDALETCDPPAARSFRTTLNAIDGARPGSQLYGDAGSALDASRIELRGEFGVAVKSHRSERTVHFGTAEESAPRHRLGFIARRPSWRQLQ